MLKPLVFILLLINASFAQVPLKTFDKDGLKFSYPASWTLVDLSADTVQHLRLSRPNSQVLISIVSPRSVIHSYDQFREMQSDIQDRFMINIKQSLNTEAQATREESACLDFNGRAITGMRYSGEYKDQPALATFFLLFWATVISI
jgi:hypothetical protein